MTHPCYLTKAALDELMAVSADYRAMNQARRDKREEDEARNLLAITASERLSIVFMTNPPRK